MDADLLARHALGWDLATLVSRAADEAPAGFDARFGALIDRRLRREPVAYIRGTQEFWGRDFVVRPGVLIPRPETEFIIEEAIAWSLGRDAGAAPLRVLDIGAGSGCIAVTLALELAGARVAATDISSDALDTARENQRRLGAEVTFHHGAFLADAILPVDLLVSNPPYVTASDYLEVQPEVRDFEPVTALVSGEDGLDAIRGVVQRRDGGTGPTGTAADGNRLRPGRPRPADHRGHRRAHVCRLPRRSARCAADREGGSRSVRPLTLVEPWRFSQRVAAPKPYRTTSLVAGADLGQHVTHVLPVLSDRRGEDPGGEGI